MINLPLVLFMILVAFALVGLIAYKTIPPILSATNQTNTEIGTNVGKTPNSINFIVWGLLIASAITFIFSAIYIRTNPIFFGVSIFMLVFSIYFAMSFSNVIEVMGNNSVDVNNTINSMSSLTFLRDNFVPFVGGIGVISMILTYVYWKTRPEEGGGIGGV